MFKIVFQAKSNFYMNNLRNVVICVQRNLSHSRSAFMNKTALYDFHVFNDAKMVEFAKYQMPVQYGKIGISSSHNHVRSSCSLFDVSHMLQTRISGKDRIKFIESLIVGDIEGLSDNSGCLSLYTNHSGGIMDDLICYKIVENKEYLYVVSNAGCKEKILPHMRNQILNFEDEGKDVKLQVIDKSLIAIQGPKSSSILQKATDFDLNKLRFMTTRGLTILGINCQVSRCGYTGEDGFEISIPNDEVIDFCATLIKLSAGDLQLAGLGARDSLRLEAGLCLYGNDIDESTTPVEAMLSWTIAKRRRANADFPGAQIILNELKNKPKRKRIGLLSDGLPPRSNCKVLSLSGEEIGKVTSGCPSPSLGRNIGMAYVSSSFSKVGTEVIVCVRGKEIKATVAKMPFVKCNFFQ